MISSFRRLQHLSKTSRSTLKLQTSLELRKILTRSFEGPKLETMFVFDADRTLAASDTGEMYWGATEIYGNPVRDIFAGPMGYSHNAFRQAALLYEQVHDDDQFTKNCDVVATNAATHRGMFILLDRIKSCAHSSAIVVTCGLRRVSEILLKQLGLSDRIKVVGGGRIDNGYVVTAEVKAAIVKRLRNHYNMYVWAFGDGPLDLPMLKEADEAIVVVGEFAKRSKTMEKELDDAIEEEGLLARQLLLRSFVIPRLDPTKLPIVDLSTVLESIVQPRQPLTNLCSSNPAARLLQTPMSNVAFSGLALQAVHKKVGWFLATEHVTEAIGLEEFSISHVQGGSTAGYRLQHERNTTIVALMRSGEPMARGVHKAFPSAMFVHAYEPSDLKSEHLENQKNVLLVDSVVNNGATIVEFVNRIKRLASDARSVVVTGIAQKGSVAENGPLARVGRDGLTIVALRLSENKYTGQGGTDKGKRLFNTTRLD